MGQKERERGREREREKKRKRKRKKERIFHLKKKDSTEFIDSGIAFILVILYNNIQEYATALHLFRI